MAPRKPAENARIREQRRQEILEAALRVYVERGYQGLEIAEVARSAGVATGLVHYYFQGKRKLVQALFAAQLAEARQATAEVFRSEGTPRERLARYLDFYLRASVEHPDRTRFGQRMSLDFPEVFAPGEGQELLEGFAEFHAQLVGLLQEGMAAGDFVPRPVDLMARLVWQTLTGGMDFLMQPLEPSMAPAEAIALVVGRCMALLGE